MLISLFDSKRIIYKEFVLEYYPQVLNRFLSRIPRVSPEYWEPDDWRLIHDNAPSHRAKIIADFLTKNSFYLNTFRTGLIWLPAITSYFI